MRDNDVSKVVWSMYFCSVMSMMFHPGNKPVLTRESSTRLVDVCAEIADYMYDAFSRRFESFKE